MHATTFFVVALMGSMLAGCAPKERDQTLSREHEVKATIMCKHDKGLRRVIDTNNKNFTAECKSGIIVTGALD